MKKVIVASLCVFSMSAYASGWSTGSVEPRTVSLPGAQQQQSQSTNQTSTSQANSSIGQGSNIGNNVFNTHNEAPRIPVATAVAPAIVSSNDTCMGSSSAGISTVSIGISLGTTWKDDNCVMLKNSRELWNMGLRNAAVARMCMDDLNNDALAVTGIICPDFAAHRASKNKPNTVARTQQSLLPATGAN